MTQQIYSIINETQDLIDTAIDRSDSIDIIQGETVVFWLGDYGLRYDEQGFSLLDSEGYPVESYDDFEDALSAWINE